MGIRDLVRRLTPLRLGVLGAVVTLAFSQIVLGLISGNVEEFPEEARFHLGLLFWAWALPILALLAVDLALVRDDAAEGRVAHGWRLALYTLTAFSFLRQLQIQYWPGSFERIDTFPRLAAVGGLAVLVWALLFRRPIRLHRYFGVLGVLALLLVGRYAWAVGLWGPAWRVSGVPEERMLRGDPARPPVFVVLFDELSFDVVAGPDGSPDRARFPRLAALADEGRWFVDATTNSAHTPNAMHLMLTGSPPYKDEKPPPLLFEFLPDGYVGEALSACPPMARWIRNKQAGNPRFVQRNQAAFYVPGFFELPGRIVHGLAALPFFNGAGFDEGDFDKPGEWTHRDDRWNLETEGLISSVRSARARGRVLFWHSTLPHFPYQYDERGKPHGEAATSFFTGTPPEDVLRNYRRQCESLDLIVGRFVDALKGAGLYDDAIVLLTSDHGLRFWRNRRTIPADDRLARIPLLIKAPRLAPGVSRAEYQHVDFLPTLLELIGGQPRPGSAGVSALAAARPERPKWIEVFDVISRRNPRTGAWDVLAK